MRADGIERSHPKHNIIVNNSSFKSLLANECWYSSGLFRRIVQVLTVPRSAKFSSLVAEFLIWVRDP